MKSQSFPPSSISLHLDRQQVLETKYYWNLQIKDIFQLYLWQTGWSLATMSCRSTPRRTSSMARSASWSCPSFVDLAFTLTGWHTGWWDLFALIFLVSIFCIRSVMYGVSKLRSRSLHWGWFVQLDFLRKSLHEELTELWEVVSVSKIYKRENIC